jgi:hypothetical protein
MVRIRRGIPNSEIFPQKPVEKGCAFPVEFWETVHRPKSRIENWPYTRIRGQRHLSPACEKLPGTWKNPQKTVEKYFWLYTEFTGYPQFSTHGIEWQTEV